MIGIVICFACICILAFSTMSKQVDNPESQNRILGIILPLITSIGLAVVTVLIRYLRDLHFA